MKLRSNHNKILFVIGSLGIGGAERQMLELKKLLNEIEIYPIILTYQSEAYDYPDSTEEKRVRISATNKYLLHLKIVLTIGKMKPDIVLAYGRKASVCSLITSVFTLRRNCIVSERNHDSKYSFRTRLRFQLYRKALKVVPNSWSQSGFIRTHAPYLNSKVLTITNYTNPDRFSFKPKEKSERLVVGIFARYHVQKNTLGLLEAVRALGKYNAQLQFHWHGQKYLDGSDSAELAEYYLQCEAVKEKYGLENVYLNDFCNDVQLAFERCDAICLPSFKEGFSNIISEAICCGKPILASSVSDNKILVRDGENGFLFDPSNRDDMIKAFVRFSHLSQEELYAMQMRSRQIAESLFDKEAYVMKYLDALGLEYD